MGSSQASVKSCVSQFIFSQRRLESCGRGLSSLWHYTANIVLLRLLTLTRVLNRSRSLCPVLGILE
uniref:Uncharacterized protein n=1 Tax=Utricularia reniformis TaxID=192314 RepID=A0A1Y0B383_9LAMI|nr:hypothetical protein AEK19_MT1659 [Utricularia reniformis]ART31843.1 hypothetical protein AEK19_MT1659 [Utricularia reniformis]